MQRVGREAGVLALKRSIEEEMERTTGIVWIFMLTIVRRRLRSHSSTANGANSYYRDSNGGVRREVQEDTQFDCCIIYACRSCGNGAGVLYDYGM